MDAAHMLLFTALLISASAIDGARADAIVTGTVFCDQCKDGELSVFDYPLPGREVKISCPGSSDGQILTKEETTDWFGNFAIRFEGAPDLSNCYAQVSGKDEDSTGCGAAAGPAQSLRLMFRMFDMEMYSVDSLLSQPAQPMSTCPRTPNPVAPPPTGAQSPPPLQLPPPPLPGLPQMPPMPFVDASPCPHEKWTMPEYKCYWRAVNPETKVAVVFGLAAARRYGTDITLWRGLQGRGDLYRTLLREGITAFLNSYNSLQFPYQTMGVIYHMNCALVESPGQALLTAMRFRRANSGTRADSCKFTPCN